MSFLLDTCVLSEIVAKRPVPHVLHWIDEADADRLYLSVLTIGEIEKGIAKLPDSHRRVALTAWLQEELLVRFRDHILTLDLDVVRRWGRLAASLEEGGTPMPAVDSLLAATALHHGMTLVTRNVGDFLHSGVEIFNPWELAP